MKVLIRVRQKRPESITHILELNPPMVKGTKSENIMKIRKHYHLNCIM